MPRWVFILLGLLGVALVVYYLSKSGAKALPSGNVADGAAAAGPVINPPGTQYGNLT